MGCGNCETCSCNKGNDTGNNIGISEQQAIKQFLSKPAPSSYACGCMGQQPIPDQDKNINYLDLKVYPVCPCQMKMIEEVEGRFYMIKEIRSPDGITHTASYIGPVGGPYLCNQYGEIK